MIYKGLDLFRVGRGDRRRIGHTLCANTFTLAVATVAIGTSGHAVAGLMPELAATLNTPPAVVGQLGALWALTCAVAGPLLAVATGRWRRRTLLVSSLTVCGVGNAVAALAPHYVWLAVGRVVTAVGAATATAVAVGVAVALNAPRSRGRAAAVVVSGLTASLAAGVPAAHALATAVSYPAVLAGIAILCVGSAALLRALLPPDARQARPRSAGRRVGLVAGDHRVGRVLVGALLLWTATFTVYPFLTVLLDRYSGGHGVAVSLLLAAYGVGAWIGTLAGGAATDAWGPRPSLIVAAAVAGLGVLVLTPTTDSVAGPVLALAAWGAAGWSTPAAINAWVVSLAPERAAVVLSLAGSAIYGGMAFGGMLGGAVLAVFGPAALPPVAATVTAVACVVLDRVDQPRRRRIRWEDLPSSRPPSQIGAHLVGGWQR